MTAKEIARTLGGRKIGAVWMARCPAHDDRVPSLSIREADGGKVLVRCHAGCDQQHVIAALRGRGLWAEAGASSHTPMAGRMPADRQLDRQNNKSSTLALGIWEEARSADGTLVETYLALRGVHLLLPPTLRYHPGLKHPSGDIWPCMVALVTRGTDDMPLAIHRTFLSRDAGKAPLDPAKMMLGPCRGCAVRLGEPGDVQMDGEGIGSCRSAMQVTGIPAWAALSTSGLRTLDLPAAVKDIIILADGDEAGEAAARDCARRWQREGRRVRIARPPWGMDFNDLLRVSSCAIQGIVT